jgi:hypothetical protein
LRCVYCETDVDTEAEGSDHALVVADTSRKTFSHGLAALTKAPAEKLKHLVIYRNEADAVAAGFQSREIRPGKLRIG